MDNRLIFLYFVEIDQRWLLESLAGLSSPTLSLTLMYFIVSLVWRYDKYGSNEGKVGLDVSEKG